MTNTDQGETPTPPEHVHEWEDFCTFDGAQQKCPLPGRNLAEERRAVVWQYVQRRQQEDGWAAGLRTDARAAATPRPEPTDEERVQRLRDLMGDDGERRITNGADIAAVFRLLDAERAELAAVRRAVAAAAFGRHMIDPYELAAVMNETIEPREQTLTAGERRAAVEALRSLPEHIVPNMSLVAQIDRRADAIEKGAEL